MFNATMVSSKVKFSPTLDQMVELSNSFYVLGTVQKAKETNSKVLYLDDF